MPLAEENVEGEDSGFVLKNFNKIMAVLDFACSAVAYQHAVVARTARRLFIAGAQICCDEPAAYNEVNLSNTHACWLNLYLSPQ